MKFKESLAAMVAAVACVASSPAGAVIMAGHAAGIANGPFSADFAGAASGSAFVFDFTYDSELGGPVQDPGQEYQDGGAFFGAGNLGPLLSAKLTIGGASVQFNMPPNYSYVSAAPGFFQVIYAEQGGAGTNNGDYVNFFVSGVTATAETSAPATFSGNCHACGTFRLTPTGSPNSITSDGAFDVTSFTVAQQGVPEPAIWTMMIAGFAATGSMLRRRRNVACATA
jgi:hypothetical protein